MRLWVKTAVTAAAVLGLGGWIAEPYVQDWWVLRTACEGALPDAARRLQPDGSHLTDAGSRHHPGLGRYECGVTWQEGDARSEYLFLSSAFTDRDDQDTELQFALGDRGEKRWARVPDGLPGFLDALGRVQLLLTCPDLGKDADGRPRKKLVRTGADDSANGNVSEAYDTAVALANGASRRLGCGAEPLKPPEGDERPAVAGGDPPAVPLERATDRECGRLARAGLPGDRPWELTSELNRSAPLGSCTVFHGSGDEGAGLVFDVWYGDWSSRFATRTRAVADVRTATARCAGEAAHFELRTFGGSKDVGPAKQRELLKRFAQEQMRGRDCAALRVTG